MIFSIKEKNILNWAALFFEILGFSLLVLELYFPNKADSLEIWLDESGRVSPSFPKFNLHFQSIMLILLCLIALQTVLSNNGFEAKPLVIIDTTIFFIILISIWGLFIGEGFVVIHTLKYIYRFFLYMFSSFVLFLSRISNAIHPSDRAIGGVGVLVAITGLLIDFYQALFTS